MLGGYWASGWISVAAVGSLVQNGCWVEGISGCCWPGGDWTLLVEMSSAHRRTASGESYHISWKYSQTSNSIGYRETNWASVFQIRWRYSGTSFCLWELGLSCRMMLSFRICSSCANGFVVIYGRGTAYNAYISGRNDLLLYDALFIIEIYIPL